MLLMLKYLFYCLNKSSIFWVTSSCSLDLFLDLRLCVTPACALGTIYNSARY